MSWGKKYWKVQNSAPASRLEKQIYLAFQFVKFLVAIKIYLLFKFILPPLTKLPQVAARHTLKECKFLSILIKKVFFVEFLRLLIRTWENVKFRTVRESIHSSVSTQLRTHTPWINHLE